MNFKIITTIVFIINNLIFSQGKTYYNYSLFNVQPTEPDHLLFLYRLNNQKYIDVIFWKEPKKLYENVQLIVNPIDKELFEERAAHYKIPTKLLVNNIQRAFDDQQIQKYDRLNVDSYSWRTYHTLEDIYQWLADVTLKYPEIVELTSIGKSAEGRDIFAITIKTKSSNVIVIADGGIHGNEWISVEVVTFLVDQLIKNLTKKTKVGEVLKNYEWHLIPILNPDGYVYTHTTDRLWRKNRRLIAYTNTFGVDLNRNFDYSFGKYGTSINPNNDYYCGPHAFSEPESKLLANFTSQKENKLRYYFSFHAYGQKIIIPFGDKITHLSNYAEAENYGKLAISEMNKINNVKYDVGTFYDTSGNRISGNSASYIKKTHGVRYVYTFLLRDNGSYGYALPSNQILPTCKETFNGIIELMRVRSKTVQLTMSNSGERLTTSVVLMFSLILIILYVKF